MVIFSIPNFTTKISEEQTWDMFCDDLGNNYYVALQMHTGLGRLHT